MRKYPLLCAATTFLCLSIAQGAPPPASPAPAARPPETLDNYHVEALPANIAPTAATQPQPDVAVHGQPRQSVGHPCTLLDAEDITALKAALTTNPDEKKAFDKLKAACDKRIAEPVNVPAPLKAPDGSWAFPGTAPQYGGNLRAVYHVNEENATSMANLGMMYQLTGDSSYADFCKQLIVGYAANYNSYGHPLAYAGHPEGVPWTPASYRSAFDGRLTGQFLEDGFWLCEVAYAYDLIYNLPSWTADERTQVRDDLLKAVAKEFYDPIEGKDNYVSSTHNRSALCTSGVLIAGYATEDPELINTALYGSGGTKDAPTGGVIAVHFGEKCILPDGLWNEGAPAYQVGIAAGGLCNDAETLWHHGIDMYRYRGGAFKRFLDSAIALAYPDPKMSVAALHDSARFSLIDARDWFNNEAGVPYECGFRRYEDARYIPIINNATKLFSMTVHAGPPSLFLTLPSPDTVPPRPVESVNFYAVGYGVLRANTPSGGNQVIQEFGPSGSHAHPSKLGLDVYALGDQTMPFPGVIFPYGDKLDFNWYWTTFANNALVVDESSQVYAAVKYKYPRGTPDPDATQLIFAPADTCGMQRAWSNTVQPGVIEDRAVFLTPNYLVDLFGGFGSAPHTYDLAWHLRGTMTTSLPAEPFQFPGTAAPGYNAVDKLTRSTTDQAWIATVATRNQQTVRMLSPGGLPTDVYLGTGHYFIDSVKNEENPAVLVERRAGQKNVIFGTVADLSGNAAGYVKSVTQEGSLEAGYGVLKIQTPTGTDVCFSSYRPGNYSAAGVTTDAMQAFVQMDGASPRALYLAGGTSLKASDASLQRSEPGLAYVEKTAGGSYVIGNPSPTDAKITVTLPALKNRKAYKLDAAGKRSGSVSISEAKNAIVVAIPAAAKIELAAP